MDQVVIQEKELSQLFERLLAQVDYRPENQELSGLLTQLVGIACHRGSAQCARNCIASLCCSERLCALRKVCQKAEFQLEKYWAKRIASSAAQTMTTRVA